MSSWTQQISPATFSKRDEAQVFIYNDKLWMNGGYEVGTVARRDLLNSVDGIHWDLINASTPYDGFAPGCAHNGYMYFAGGTQVYRTTDGISFDTLMPNSPYPGLIPSSPMLSFNGKIYIVAGAGIWSSADGIDWAFCEPDWAPRVATATKAVTFNGRLYVFAGAYNIPNSPAEVGYPGFTSLNDVWSSDTPADAVSWVRNIEHAPWSPRMWPGIAVHGGFIYLGGGYNNILGGTANFGDTWRSQNAEDWEQIILSSSFSDRHAPALYSWYGNFYLAAGNTNSGTSTQSDVWKLTLSGNDMTDYAPVFYNTVDDTLKYDNGSGPVNISTAASGRLLRRTIFTSSGTWTKQSDVGFVIVTAVGGGGGGGGCSAAAAVTAASAGGGGAGATSNKKIAAASLGSTETVTIGAAGTGGAAGMNSGNAGGTTSFGSHVSCTGGNGGGSSGGASSVTIGGTGANGGTATGGDFNIAGEPGNAGLRFGTVPSGIGGSGGSSKWGVGGGPAAASTNITGKDAGGYGGGGGGSSNSNNTATAGGNGTAGVVIVEEYSA